MRRIYGLVIAGSALIGATSAANAQVVVSPGNGMTPTQVTVGQPYLNGGYAPNVYGPAQYSRGYVQGYQGGTTVMNPGYRGYYGPRTVYQTQRVVRPYRMGRPRFGWKRVGRPGWYRTNRNY